jgi:hypothetical protein
MVNVNLASGTIDVRFLALPIRSQDGSRRGAQGRKPKFKRTHYRFLDKVAESFYVCSYAAILKGITELSAFLETVPPAAACDSIDRGREPR